MEPVIHRQTADIPYAPSNTPFNTPIPFLEPDLHSWTVVIPYMREPSSSLLPLFVEPVLHVSTADIPYALEVPIPFVEPDLHAICGTSPSPSDC